MEGPMEAPAAAPPSGSAPPGLTVRPVESARDRKRFLDFVYRHYAGSRHFVPPLRVDQEKTLDPKKNPFFEHGRARLFLAENGRGEVVGRVAAIVNGMHLAKYDDDVGFFGFFEAVEHYAVAEVLLDAACGWLREGGLRAVRGPVNPTINDVAGLLVEGFDRAPSILMPYNKPYYEGVLLRYGFARAMTMFSYYVHDAYLDAARLERGAGLIRQRHPNLRVRTLDMSRFMDEALVAHAIYNEAWSGNWGSVPMTDAEFRHLATDLKQIIEPDLVFFVELQDAAGRWEPVAFSVAIPNLNQAFRHVKDGRLFPLGLPKLLAYAKLGAVYELRLPLLGVKRAYHGLGFDVLMVMETVKAGRAKGYEACEMGWVLESNKALTNALDRMNTVKDKTYALFERAI
jgi:hypothetical protein